MLVYHWEMTETNAADGVVDVVGGVNLSPRLSPPVCADTALGGVGRTCSSASGQCFYRNALTTQSTWGAVSICLWMRTNGGIPAEAQGLFYQFGSWVIILRTDGTIDGGLYEGSSYYIDPKSAASVADNEWHHIAFTYNGSVVTLYVDGVAVDTRDRTGNVSRHSSETRMTVGATWNYWEGAPHNFFNGDLDDVRVYNHALSAADVAALVRAGGITVEKTPYSFGYGAQLPKTGQTTVHTAGDDGTYQVGRRMNTRFIDHGDTISDRATGLMWIKTPWLAIPGTEDVTFTAGYGWAYNTSYTVGQIVSIGDKYFDDWMYQPYYTGQEIRHNGVAWVSTTDNNYATPGNDASWTPTSLYYHGPYRCLADHTSPPQPGWWNTATSYTAGDYVYDGMYYYECLTSHTSGTNTITDDINANPTWWSASMVDTDMAWALFQDEIAAGRWAATPTIPSSSDLTITPWVTWQDAITQAVALEYAGYTDWRLPNVHELVTIYEWASTASGNLFSPFAQSAYLQFIWSGTTKGINTGYVYSLDLIYGAPGYRDKNATATPFFVRGGI